MKVLFLGRQGLFDSLGGDRIQMEQTAENLRRLGVEVVVKANDYREIGNYDLIHVFQLDWNPDCYFQISSAQKHKKPVVFSPIHHKLEEVKRFDDEFVFDFRRLSRFLFKNQFHRDLFKEFYRTFSNPKRLWVILFCMLRGLKNMYIYALKNSNILLVQTRQEAEDLKNTFGVNVTSEVIPNGVSEVYLADGVEYPENPLGFSDYLLCVGRIEPRKNQLSIINAVKMLRDEQKIDFKLVFVGAKPQKKKHFEYVSKFEAEMKNNPWIIHVPHVKYEQMPTYYHFAKVGISASWFETTGLTSLEAIFCRTNAVASGTRAHEYLGNNASYCDPGDVGSIKEAIKKEYFSERPTIDQAMREKYTWANAAKQTLAVYNSVLSKL